MNLEQIMSGAAWLLGRLLPVKRNKIVVSHFYGRGYGDSPKAIVEALLQREEKLDIVWLRKDPKEPLPQGVRGASYGAVSRIFHLSTAKVWVDDCRKGARFKKKGQYYLQTWHGFALKRIEGDAGAALSEAYGAYARRDAGQTDLMVSGSRFMTDCYRRAFWYSGEIAEYGSPRNDVLFAPPEGLEEKVRSALGIPTGKKLVLYAPTFRVDDSLSPYSIDMERVIAACERRFGGDFVLLLRLHPNVDKEAGKLRCDGIRVFQVTLYPDIQELLTTADVVITDYSSLMFDFALRKLPVFQFATDIEEYRKDRNFNFSLDQLPFSLAQNNEELERSILTFEETAYQQRLAAFFQSVGMKEDGHAADRCADWILAKIQG